MHSLTWKCCTDSGKPLNQRSNLRCNRVIHSWHLWSSFLHHFPFLFVSIFLKIETENKWKMIENGTLTSLLWKWTIKMIIFNSSFWQCAWREKCILAPFFKISLPGARGFTVTIFHIIFHFIFSAILFVPLPNSWKWVKEWPKNGNREQS